MKPATTPPAKVCCLKCARLVQFGIIEGPHLAEPLHLVSCPAGMPCPRALPCHYSFGSMVPGCAPCAIFAEGYPTKVQDNAKSMDGPAALPGNGPTLP
jgi:hypothetical protein